ncbi:GH3 auxin-responsive promoter [Singulisphaera sp. GP187]|uniref:GH3 auxin-responsive promoter family protein n=1 Tax=Singulisphaera sp. GP187 TaxID=1882752 RepID=UPI000926F211|nr:GH3 auxin-responsive promoter family protein [Singulisphaera sp. GP187]SIO04249.1 GH3 auxin-responsive promoter [Singulisphaera sp. GP187]
MLYLFRKYAGLPLLNRSRRLARHFLAQTSRADEVQRDLLMSRIARHAESQFGRDHHFHEIRTPADFRRRVPIRAYDAMEPYIDRVRQGDLGALFGAGTKVLMFAMTSGTTNRPKTIPVTQESLNDYREGWTIWGIQAFDAHPQILARGLLPILQIASDWRESMTPSGIPCGAITGLTAHMQNPLIRLTYCMPAIASRIKDIESKYYVALRLSVFRNLGTTIAANPSTILAIARLGDREKATLIRDIADGTLNAKWDLPADVREALRRKVGRKHKKAARRLEAIVNQTGRLLPKDYWPNLCFLANWTGGTMGSYLRNYPEYFGDRPVRDVGLIASEGRMTIPIEDGTPAGVLDIRHHYFEFIPEDQADREAPETVEAHELIEGQRYFILPTTAGGLYRYQIHDLIRCVGFHGKAPVIEFLNKGAHFSSLTGEKLSEFQVVAAVSAAQRTLNLRIGSFLLLPSWGDPPHYNLLVEESDLVDRGIAEALAHEVEAELQRLNLEYENKRSTLRLGPIRIRRIPTGSWSDFQKRRLARSGGTVEQYKQPHLMPDLGALETFRLSDTAWTSLAD